MHIIMIIMTRNDVIEIMNLLEAHDDKDGNNDDCIEEDDGIAEGDSNYWCNP